MRLAENMEAMIASVDVQVFALCHVVALAVLAREPGGALNVPAGLVVVDALALLQLRELLLDDASDADWLITDDGKHYCADCIEWNESEDELLPKTEAPR